MCKYTHVRADSLAVKYNQLCALQLEVHYITIGGPMAPLLEAHYITIGPMAPLLELGSPTAISSFISLGGLATFLILTALRSAVSCGHGSAVAPACRCCCVSKQFDITVHFELRAYLEKQSVYVISCVYGIY